LQGETTFAKLWKASPVPNVAGSFTADDVHALELPVPRLTARAVHLGHVHCSTPRPRERTNEPIAYGPAPEVPCDQRLSNRRPRQSFEAPSSKRYLLPLPSLPGVRKTLTLAQHAAGRQGAFSRLDSPRVITSHRGVPMPHERICFNLSSSPPSLSTPQGLQPPTSLGGPPCHWDYLIQ
jgi:hypothetical protein